MAKLSSPRLSFGTEPSSEHPLVEPQHAGLLPGQSMYIAVERLRSKAPMAVSSGIPCASLSRNWHVVPGMRMICGKAVAGLGMGS